MTPSISTVPARRRLLAAMLCGALGTICTIGTIGATAAQAAAAPIRIGSILSTTGAAGYLGDPELKTLQLYIDKINAAGGVSGRKLELVHYDDGSEANKANAYTKRLIDSDQVDIIIGGTTTGSSMAMIPLVEKAGMPFISMAAGVAIVEPVHRWVFKVAPTDRMAAEKVFADMRERRIASIALLAETSGFGQSGAKEARAVAAKYGITIASYETYGPKDTDMTAQLAKIKAAPGIQAVFVFGAGQGPAVVTRNYRQLALTAPLYQSHGVASEEFIRLAGPAADGVRLPATALVVAAQLDGADPQKAVVTSYETDYRARYKGEVSSFGGHGYDALMIGLEAIRKAGGTDKAKVRDAIEATRGHMGTGGIFTMSARDHMGLDLGAFRMLEIKGGKWQLQPASK